MAELKEYISATFPLASNPPISELRRVSDLIKMAMGALHASQSFKDANWQEISSEFPIQLLGVSGDSIARRIIAHFQSGMSQDMIYDSDNGVLTRKDVALKAQVLRSVIASLPGERVAVLLPSVTATTVVLAAVYLAGKVPVMLNWTVGETNFRHCLGLSGATKIVTSRSFLKKANIRYIE
jgi:long-chain-fatty-acid--[acyl-carrier-protein] ligase